MNVSKKTMKVWEKNLKQGYRFFQPHNAIQLTPRTMREALGYKQHYELKTSEFNMNETTKAYAIGIIVLLVYIGTWLF